MPRGCARIGPTLGVLRSLVVVAVACQAVTLRSSDGADHAVDTWSAIAHSGMLRHLIDDPDACADLVVPLPGVADTELGRIVEFVDAVNVHQFRLAAQWARDRPDVLKPESRCQLLIAANYLDMRFLTIAIASTTSVRRDIPAMQGALPENVFRFVTGIAQLAHAADTEEKQALAAQIHDVIVRDGNATNMKAAVSLISYAVWDAWLMHTVLQWAAIHAEELVVELLVIYVPGIAVNLPDRIKMTPLHMAVAACSVGVVELLLKVPDINVNAREPRRGTPLLWAVTSGQERIVEVLLKAPGINVNTCDADRRTPLYMAVKVGRRDIVALLLTSARIDVNSRTRDEKTPLHRASINGRADLVELLLNATDIDVSACDNLQRTPRQWAAIKGYDRIVTMLLRATPNAVDRSHHDGAAAACSG